MIRDYYRKTLHYYICYTLSVVVPVASSVTGVLAKTVKNSAMPPFEIQILEPFRMKCFPSGDNSEGNIIL